MKTDSLYKVNRPKVINETIDGETIIINFDNGNYYRLDEIGSAIWDALEKYGSSDKVVSHIASVYKENGQPVQSHVTQFLSNLEKEDLIMKLEVTVEESSHSQQEINPGLEQTLFNIPKIEKYEDMQAFLLADPIHEVEETGWPDIKK